MTSMEINEQDIPEADEKPALSSAQKEVYRNKYRTMLRLAMPPVRVRLLILLSRIPQDVIDEVLVQPRGTNRKVQFRHQTVQELDATAAFMLRREQWDEACPLYRRVLALQRASYHPISNIGKFKDHVLIHTTYNHLIYVLLHRHDESNLPNRFEKAMELYQEMLDSNWKSFSSVDYRGSNSWTSCQVQY